MSARSDLGILCAPFSHIYVEEGVLGHPRTRAILRRFPRSTVIPIGHYKDVFCRRRQQLSLQNREPALILAEKRVPLVYPGAPVCQSFDERFFYYTSCVMNCLYDCEYCYLKGMYPSGNLVIFVNIEDIFDEVGRLLTEHEVYLCISYDTDLMALEEITGYIGEWSRFAAGRDGLKIECRTKSARTDLWQILEPSANVIFAFTLSPQMVIAQYEHGTPSLQARIACVREAMKAGFLVRLCFDPVIYVSGWREQYALLLDQVRQQIEMTKLYDVSVGTFRISQDYLKKIRKALPDSAVVQFPFENDNGVYHYPKDLMEEMEEFVAERLKRDLGQHKIFRWGEISI